MVIADDESIIRKRLVETIDWEKLGITVCGAASNGIEALELVKKESPHLLLTDIRMPGLSGLELIEKMMDVNKAMKTIILTGFSEFAYAQKAVKLGVHDFLVKPIDEKELMKSIKNVATKIQKQNEEKMRLQIFSVLKGDKEYMDEIYQNDSHPIQMKEMIDVIHSHYHEQITLHDLANRFYISDSYLSRIFKQYTGKNFIDYLTDLRISKAKELLQHSTLKTNEISKSVGYADQRYFSQIFKKLTGNTPSEFKALRKKSEH
ncbi:response regulator transcription factor [Bacillus sp. REN16]|uniref:response regulator transcription factor n=1 Tax=Bacillus sp. REN16 TaxID=2887296 RepID=UPI001E442A20|nr:response regulator [Bacillus sp. REN16]MCC3356104.1 response regulator [Bacillus sp. REN16]